MKPVVFCRHLSFSYGSKKVFEDLLFQIPAGSITCFIGPDGAGKSTLLSLISGTRALQQGTLEVLGTCFRHSKRRTAVMERIAYMPQGLGKNLYFSLTVEENLTFFASLYSGDKENNRRRIALLTEATGLEKFLQRPAGKLSGGMKQKLGLCCALIHTPDLLILDEPTTGVDPLARRQFRELLRNVKRARPQMSIIISTAYMDEAANSDFVIVMDHGKLLAQGTPAGLLRQTESENLESAFIALLPEEQRKGHKKITVTPQTESSKVIIEAHQLTRVFGSFTAVDKVSFRIFEGEIFGFLGSNGCGKTTTMRMLTGLLPPSSGDAKLFGTPVTDGSMESRKILGYMTQNFSLYNELSVRQNLLLYARLYGIPEEQVRKRTQECIERFQLEDAASLMPGSLPPGIRQKLSLAAAILHKPRLLILDEPTSGVDPVTRDKFWELILELSRKDKVTIFISTHFMNEAQRCDRISLMHAGKSLVCDTPERIVKIRHCSDLESAFISFLEEYSPAAPDKKAVQESLLSFADVSSGKVSGLEKYFSFRRFFSCFKKEFEELVRDPVRITLALFGTLILMVVMGFGISMDVENLTFSVLDRDNSESSRNYILNIAGSRYFKERPPLKSYDEMEQRMNSGELSMVIEIPPRFGRDLARNADPKIGVWVDGSMPMRAETINGYIRAMHAKWLAERSSAGTGNTAPQLDVEVRYRYNPDVRSLPAMVPGVIPVLLMMLPAALTALAVVREKENGSIINLYATPLTRAEFMLGKQLPYIIFGSLSALFMVAAAETLFHVHVKGNIFLLLAALVLYAAASTGFGLLCSAVTRSQIAALFLTMMCTMLPAVQLCGLVTPVETQGVLPRFIGSIYPTTYMLLISRGIFNKNLDFRELFFAFIYFLIAVPLIAAGAVCLQKKQEK
ncbi:MAG: ribosome-associated ATPase/putative transporter RbbA [Lentisphaeria bacterium]|nr:ribosome-associated ATPase/putative transporter RbbA [Lentisphaeria bacterium]